MNDNQKRSVVRMSLAKDVTVELDLLDLPGAIISVHEAKNPNELMFCFESKCTDHIFLVDRFTGHIRTFLFRTKGSAKPWSCSHLDL